MKRFTKISSLLILLALLLGIGYAAYQYRDSWLPYLTDPAKILDKIREKPAQEMTPPTEIAPEQEITPGPEITPAEEEAPPPLGQVVFLGDSITYRWDMPVTIGRYETINQGIDGNSTASMVLRFNKDVVDLQPDKVVILGGVNDLLFAFQFDLFILDMHLEKTAGNIELMTKIAKKEGIDPILCSVLPVQSAFRLPAPEVNEVVKTLNSSIAEVAARQKVTYLDLWPVLIDPDTQQLSYEYVKDDGVHLSDRGYEQLEEAFAEVLE